MFAEVDATNEEDVKRPVMKHKVSGKLKGKKPAKKKHGKKHHAKKKVAAKA